jgi:hypothetical protein
MPPSPPFLEHLYTVKVKERRWAAINIITVYTTTTVSLFSLSNVPGITLFIFRCVHDIGTPHGVANEAEEAQGQSNDDASENWVAVPHAAESSSRFVVHAHCPSQHTHPTVSLVSLRKNNNRLELVLRCYHGFSLSPYLNIVLENAVEELGQIFRRDNIRMFFGDVMKVIGCVNDDETRHWQCCHGD